MSTPKDNETNAAPSQPEKTPESDQKSDLPKSLTGTDFPISNDPNAGGSGTSTGD